MSFWFTSTLHKGSSQRCLLWKKSTESIVYDLFICAICKLKSNLNPVDENERLDWESYRTAYSILVSAQVSVWVLGLGLDNSSQMYLIWKKSTKSIVKSIMTSLVVQAQALRRFLWAIQIWCWQDFRASRAAFVVYYTSVHKISLQYKCTQNQLSVQVYTKSVECTSVHKTSLLSVHSTGN